MKRYTKNLRRVGAAAAVTVVTLSLAGPALAADTQVTNRETVLVELSSSGKVQNARLFSQLAVTGNGSVTVLDPTSTRNLRNLDGFGGPSVKNGQAQFTLSTSGTSEARTVSDFDTKKLPVTVDVEYKLNGKTIKPGDLVGKKGDVEVSYHVKNVSATPTDITYEDGHGNTINETLSLVTPYVGQLTTVLPKSFSDIDAPRADQAGDGKGGTQLAWTMVLFSPIGETDQTFGWKAHVKDAIAPAALVQIVPVPPSRKPELKFGEDGFVQGAETGATLTAGATLIDSNLIKLRDGASDLLTGLAQLQAGAVQLDDGLSGQALPGSQQLSSGLDQAAGGADLLAEGLKRAGPGSSQLSAGITKAHSGSSQLSSGLQQLKGGTSQLSEGFHSTTGQPDLIGGSQDLASALGLISGGLAQLAGVSGIPAALTGLQTLRAGLDHPAGLQGPSDPGGLLQGLQRIALGLSNSACDPADPTNPANPCGAKQALPLIRAGVSNPACSLSDPLNPANPCGVKEVVGAVSQQLSAAAASGGPLDGLIGAAKAGYAAATCPAPGVAVPVSGVLPPSAFDPATQAVCFYYSTLAYGLALPANTDPSQPLGGVKAQTQTAGGALGAVVSGIDAKLLPGIASLQAGIDLLAAGAVSARDAVNSLILPGVDQLIAGLTTAVTGLDQLAPGAAAANAGAGLLSQKIAEAGDGAAQIAAGTSDAASGASQLDSGLGQLDSGGKELAGGLGAAVSGSQELSVGIHQLNAGGRQLADGLKAAADGSAKLADGAGQAHDGAGQIVDGASQLQSQGTSQLVKAGDDTTKQFGREAAIMTALNQKAASGGLPYGAPSGATGSAAYSYELAAATGEGGRNATRAALALGLFVLAGLAGTVIHRRFA